MFALIAALGGRGREGGGTEGEGGGGEGEGEGGGGERGRARGEKEDWSRSNAGVLLWSVNNCGVVAMVAILPE